MKLKMKYLAGALLLLLCLAASPPRYGGSLVLGLRSMPGPLALDPDSREALQLQSLVYEKLFIKDDNDRPFSRILTVYTNLQQTSYQLRVKPRVLFQDGTKPGSRDLVYSLDRARKIDPLLHEYLKSARLLVLDERRLEISFNQPEPMFAQMLCSAALILVPAQSANEAFPPGTGAFAIANVSAKRIELQAFEKHHAGRPYLERVSLVLMPGNLSASSALQAGFVRAALEDSRGLDGFSSLSSHSTSLVYLAVGSGSAVLDKPQIRRGIGYSLDKSTLVEVFLSGKGNVTRGYLPPHVASGPHYLNSFSYDPDLARQSIIQAAEGQSLPQLVLSYPESDRALKQVAERVQVDLMQAGLSILLSRVTDRELKQATASREFDLMVGKTLCLSSDPSALILPFLDQSEKQLYMSLLKSSPENKARGLLDLEKELLENARVIPLYHEDWDVSLPDNLYRARINGLGGLLLADGWYQGGDR